MKTDYKLIIGISRRIYIYIYKYIYIYIYIIETERKRMKERERERKIDDRCCLICPYLLYYYILLNSYIFDY